MEGYKAFCITERNNYGADILVSCDKDKKKGFLICCMQTGAEAVAGDEGAEQLRSAVKVYEKKYQCSLSGTVVTNGKRFSEKTADCAKTFSIRLIAGGELAELIKKYPVRKTHLSNV